MWLRICIKSEKLKMKIMKSLNKSNVMYVKENVKINYAPIRKICFGRNFVVRKTLIKLKNWDKNLYLVVSV